MILASVAVWAKIWAFVLVASISVFSVLAVAVAIGGFRDLKVLLSDRSDAPESRADDTESSGADPDEDTSSA